MGKRTSNAAPVILVYLYFNLRWTCKVTDAPYFTGSLINNTYLLGVVGWCEGVVYLTSPGRPTDIGLQLGRGYFYFFCFFTFIPVPLSSLFISFLSSTITSISFLPFFGRRHKMTHKGWRVVKPQHNQSYLLVIYICISTYTYAYVLLWVFLVDFTVEPKYTKISSLWPGGA